MGRQAVGARRARVAKAIVTLLVLFASTPARADERLPPPRSRLEMWLAGVTFSASLRDVRFSGAGTSLGDGRVSFEQTGRDLGLERATFYGGELGVAYRHTYFAAGLMAFMAGGTASTESKPTNPYLAGLVRPGNPFAYGGAVELLGALPIGPITVSIGSVAGVRAFQIPLDGLAPDRCTERGRSYTCSTDANTAALPFVQPRFRLDLALEESRSIFLGGFMGVQVLGEASVAGGLMLGVRTANISL